MLRAIFLILLILNTSCASIFGRGKIIHGKYQEKKVVVVLGGGLSRAYSEIGVLRVLEREEIPIDYVIGTETGALIGVFYADQKSTFNLEWKLFQLKKSELFDEVVFGKQNSIMFGKGVYNFINEHLVSRDLSNLKPRVSVVTTDLRKGTTSVFESGPPATLITASMAIPGIYPPVEYKNRELVSGALSAGNLPLAEAEIKNVDLIIAVDPIGNYTFPSTNTFKDVLAQDYFRTGKALTPQTLDTPVVIITPNLHAISPFDTDRRKEAFVLGMRATEAKLPEIKKILEE